MPDPLTPNYSFSDPLVGTWAGDTNEGPKSALKDRERIHHQQFLTSSSTPLTSISDLLLSWSRGEWLIIDSHSYHPDFYINWRLRKLVGAVMSGKVYKAMGPDGEVYRVEGWETEHKEDNR